MRKNSIKNIRINEEVLRELSDIIRNKVKDPRIAPVTSVTSVEVAPDLKTCKIWISVLGDEEAEKKTMEGLNSSKNFIRHELARTVNLRNTPELYFHLDTSIAYGVHMSKMIDEVNHGLKVSDLSDPESPFPNDSEKKKDQ
ncbi:MAG: 30S ribosome-binding factor RbfA [Lachnospiraceae bacterium]|nr:30S ribosome-binding factor RbfA [Lachnospiraceae bacterium]MDD6448441.1 30S ribosome-binding factor RbfA [Lachnospiraceae bacterium]MDD6451700.1 30S ribosome-binding factor RbfA [Lachnospiraceae bacterium]MDD6579151.1 30S ribosome-binding factor RbfA [Lachnospiraceae bacterium]